MFGAAVGSLALLAGAVMLVLRLEQPPEYPIDRSRDPDGELVGRVASVEPGVILLSSEAPGGSAVPVVVTKDTRVMLGTIEGWMNDVQPGGQIKVAYDLYEGQKLARVVDVLPEGARPTTAQPAMAAPAAPPATPAPTLQPEPPPATPAPVPAPRAEPPAPRPKAETPRVTQPKATPPSPSPAQEPDTTDGSAAVDWFLKNRR